MNEIWPAREIALPRVGDMEDGEPWLGNDRVEQVLSVVAPNHSNILDKPVTLDSGCVRLIALVLLGEDGLGGRGTLLLRVTNERQAGPLIKLAVVSYAQIGGSERRRLRPGQVGDMLDRFVQRLADIPGLAAQQDPEEW